MDSAPPARLLPALEAYVSARLAERDRIEPERLAALDALATAVAELPSDGGAVLFVCTHNSRRSHLAHVWAEVAAVRFGFERLRAFSAGTEATALAQGAADALRRAGFRLVNAPGSDAANPLVLVTGFDAWSDDGPSGPGEQRPPIECFSKTLEHETLPRRDFVAVMTCTSADAACPNVAGASARIALPYRDPKEADGRPDADAAYDACCATIAREMLEAYRRAREAQKRS